MKFQFPPRVLSVQAACHYLSVSPSTIHRITSAGELRTIRLTPGRIGYLRDELDRWIDANANIQAGHSNEWDDRLADAS